MNRESAGRSHIKKAGERTWIVYVIRGKRPADRLGTVRATDSDTAIAKAIETFGITDPERQRRVIVQPIAQSDHSKSG
jgi:hypothetical protein